jgi:hypothetical protein
LAEGADARLVAKAQLDLRPGKGATSRRTAKAVLAIVLQKRTSQFLPSSATATAISSGVGQEVDAVAAAVDECRCRL